MTTTCKKSQDLEAAFDSVCRVVGTYQVKDFYTKKKTLLASWPVPPGAIANLMVACVSPVDSLKVAGDQEPVGHR